MNKARFLFGLCLVMAPLNASASGNTLASTAAPYRVGQGWVNVPIDAANPQRWYRFPVVAGRSYCVEGVTEDTPGVTNTNYDGSTFVFRADGTTNIAAEDDNLVEPGGSQTWNPGRVCYIADEDSNHFARVSNINGPSATRSYRFRIEDTTLFCPWFFSGNGFEAFILMRNTTNTAVKATVTVRNTAGAIIGTQTGVVPANGSFNLQVSAASPNGFGIAAASGSVEIAYGANLAFAPGLNDGWAAGAPGAIVANVTSLSFGGGVSFDAPATPRQDWRN
jgi:hypothetical protein